MKKSLGALRSMGSGLLVEKTESSPRKVIGTGLNTTAFALPMLAVFLYPSPAKFCPPNFNP